MGLEMVEITMEVERHFDVTLPHQKVGDCNTFGDFVNLVVEVVNSSGTPNSDTPDRSSEVENYLRDKLISEYSVKAEHITHDAELYGKNLDLG